MNHFIAIFIATTWEFWFLLLSFRKIKVKNQLSEIVLQSEGMARCLEIILLIFLVRAAKLEAKITHANQVSEFVNKNV